MENKSIAFVKRLRQIGMLEGISYLVLLGIAMPLKYALDMPEAVKIVGWAHGVLFVWFVVLVAIVKFSAKFSYLWAAWAFIASLIPFGTFVLDWQLKKRLQEEPTVEDVKAEV